MKYRNALETSSNATEFSQNNQLLRSWLIQLHFDEKKTIFRRKNEIYFMHFELLKYILDFMPSIENDFNQMIVVLCTVAA